MPSRCPRILLASFALLCACRPSSERVTLELRAPTQGTPVARFDRGAITAEQVTRALSGLPPMVRMRYQTAAAKKEYVEGLARVELLSEEAVRRGLQNDPEVVDTLKKVLAQKLLKAELDERAPMPTDGELAAYHQQHPGEFSRPELIRVSDLFVAAPEHDPREPAQRDRASALLTRARALERSDFAGFGRLVKASSDDPVSKVSEGDLHPLSITDLTSRYGPAVAQAADALSSEGELSPLVRSPAGFHILKLRSRTPARATTFAEVRGQIRSRLLSERRTKGFQALVERLQAQRHYALDEAALAKVEVQVPASAR